MILELVVSALVIGTFGIVIEDRGDLSKELVSTILGVYWIKKRAVWRSFEFCWLVGVCGEKCDIVIFI